MLQSFKDRIRHSRWLGYTIVIAIAIPFALWGVQTYFQGADPQVAAEVNGEPIKERQVTQMVSQRRQQLSERFGGQLPDAFSDGMLREQVLNQLITRELLQQHAESAGLRVSDEQVAGRIRQQQPFQRDGEFDRELYRQRLSQAGLSPQQYEQRVRDSAKVEQLRNGVRNSAFVLDPEVRRAARLRNEERRVAVLKKTRSQVADGVSIDEQAIQRYYENNKDDFKTPRQVRIRYIELGLDKLREQVQVPEDKVRAKYKSNKEQYRAAAERKASHMLIKVPKDAGEKERQKARHKAKRLAERVRQGGNFDALARQYSDDSGSAKDGGDLGYVGRGSMVAPFEKALFGLEEPGAVAGPVKTKYGYHVIKLEDIREPKPKPFEAVRDKIRKELATKRAERLFYDRVEVLKNEAYENPGTLAPAAKATGVEIQTSDWFSRAKGEGIAGKRAVREKAFSDPVLQKGRNSKVVELGKRRVVVLRVSDEKPPQTQPLEAVREQVRKQLRRQRVEESLDQWVQATLERLRKGASIDELGQADGVEFTDAGWITSDGGDLGRGVAQTAFELGPPEDGASRYTKTSTNKGRAVVAVRGSRLPSVKDKALKDARKRLRQGLSRAELRIWIEGLKGRAEIVRHDPPKQSSQSQGAG